MATVFFDPDHPCLRGKTPGQRLPPPIASAQVGLPMDDIRGPLDDTESQRIIPFFGAGASLHRGVESEDNTAPNPFRSADVENLCNNFKIYGPKPKEFVGLAIQFAQLMDSECARASNPTDESEAPSSWELANKLATDLELEPFERFGMKLKSLLRGDSDNQTYIDIVKAVARLMDLYQTIPQLLETASYYNPTKRRELLAILRNRLGGVTKRTAIQKEFAIKARKFVDAKNLNPDSDDKPDYLFITTNYDTLIEQELRETHVPYCVINVRMDLKIFATIPPETKDFLKLTDDQFAKLIRQYEPTVDQPSNKFLPSKKTHSLAMVYKIHGSPWVPNRGFDNVVIADRDYIKFIQKNGSANVLIPAYVKRKISQSRLLFLGYSFSDWNVRSLYEQILENRLSQKEIGEDQDYVVMRSYGKTDDLFFDRWNDLSVLVTDLDAFAGQIRS